MRRTDIRLALPSKGILQDGAIEFLEACGLKVYRPNPRQYAATIPSLPGVVVMFQRPGDIVTSVRAGSIDFGITGYDVLAEKGAANGGAVLVIHDDLGFGACTLNLAVPETSPVQSVGDLRQWAREAAAADRPIRIATKFAQVTAAFLDQNEIGPFQLITVDGTLEIAPAIGYADLICDLVSSGITLRDNHLRMLEGGGLAFASGAYRQSSGADEAAGGSGRCPTLFGVRRGLRTGQGLVPDHCQYARGVGRGHCPTDVCPNNFGRLARADSRSGRCTRTFAVRGDVVRHQRHCATGKAV